MSHLLYLFLLDYSGSMYQPLQGQPKFKVVQNNIRALLSTAASTTKSGYLVFGLHPKKKCGDLEFGEKLSSDVYNVIERFRPGAFGKTPLADGIELLAKKTIETRPKRVFLFSDGADTCDKDPCQQLIESNEQLREVNYVMNLTLIGIDLGNEEKKFECFKTLQLSHIKIKYANASNSFDTQEALKENESPRPPRPPFGKVQVLGAPPDVQFQLFQKTKKVDLAAWLGSYPFIAREGLYEIRSSAKGARRVPADVGEGQILTFHWEDFFVDPYTRVKLKDNRLSLLATPTQETRTIHRLAYPFTIHGELVKEQTLAQNRLPFGSWTLQIDSPAWLKTRTPKITRAFEPGKIEIIDPVNLFGLKWDKVPPNANGVVLEIDPNERYYIPAGVLRIPRTPGLKPHWIL